jgi:hypothetical protein
LEVLDNFVELLAKAAIVSTKTGNSNPAGIPKYLILFLFPFSNIITGAFVTLYFLAISTSVAKL